MPGLARITHSAHTSVAGIKQTPQRQVTCSSSSSMLCQPCLNFTRCCKQILQIPPAGMHIHNDN